MVSPMPSPVQATSLFEAGAAAGQMREERRTGTLPPDAVLRVEVQLPPVVHEVPLRAVEKWGRRAKRQPEEELAKRRLR